jgi:3-methyl-2-oxobutanoate hydroxymethyltransferase
VRSSSYRPSEPPVGLALPGTKVPAEGVIAPPRGERLVVAPDMVDAPDLGAAGRVRNAYIQAKRRGESFAMLTSYDARDGALLHDAGVRIALVGDSVGPFRLSKPIQQVTMDDMVAVTKSVRSGLPAGSPVMVLADMPEGSYPIDNPALAVHNARRLMAAGADAIKVEGGREIAPAIEAIVAADIPVMGHIGSTPQTTGRLEGDVTLGSTPEEAGRLALDALVIQASGAFALLIKGVDADVSGAISRRLQIPVLGIEAGKQTDGQGTNTDRLLKRTAGKGADFASELDGVSAWAKSVKTP